MLWWTLQNLAVASLLAGLVWLVCRVRRIGPAARHALWLVVLMKLLTPPLIVWPWAVPAPWAISVEGGRGGTDRREGSPGATNDQAPMTSDQEKRHPNRNIGHWDLVIGHSSQTGASGEAPSSPDHPDDAIWHGTQPEPEVESNWGDAGIADVGPAPEWVDPDDLPLIPDPLPAPAMDAVIESPRPADAVPTPVAPVRASSIARWLPWAAGAIWLAGGAALALLQTVRIVRMQRRVRRGQPADEALVQKVAELAARLGVRPPPVQAVPGLSSPLIWSIARPQLLWPAALPATLPRGSLEGLIVHELAHVRRRDHWVGWLELAGGCIWWWNPLYWYVRHQLRENAELACDAWVVNSLPAGRRAYAEALLLVCECLSRTTAPLPAVGISAGSRRSFERRLTMILRDRVPLRLSRGGLLAVALLALIALPVWSPGSSAVADKTDSPVVAEPPLPALGPQPAVGPSTGGIGSSEAEPPGGRDTLWQPPDRLGIPRDLESPVRFTASAEPLPQDAQALVSGFVQEQARIRREAEQRIQTQRETLIQQLKQLQDQYTRQAKLDEAVAIRNSIRQLQAAGGGATGVRPDPGALYQFQSAIGRSFTFQVTGNADGSLWGTDVYTTDSDLSTAAVHAGVLQPGEQGTVRVTILPGQDSYRGTTRHGVTSGSWGSYPASYRIQRANGRTPAAAQTDPGTLTNFRENTGRTYTFQVTGKDDGTVWGTDVYTTDSDLSTAAIHAGVLQPGEQGIVRVTILPGQNSYEGSSRHGVSSHSWGSYPASYRIQRDDGTTPAPGSVRPDDPGSLTSYRDKVGQTFEFDVVGTTHGTVWGTNVYTDDSQLATAAVHAGVLQPGQTGTVRVTILPGRDRYTGSTRHGVTSHPYGRWGGSYVVEPVAPAGESGASLRIDEFGLDEFKGERRSGPAPVVGEETYLDGPEAVGRGSRHSGTRLDTRR